MSTSVALKEIFTAARPLIEQWLDAGEQIAALREVATAKGLDWSQVKALIKAQIQDERDESSGGKRVQKIVEKAEFASAYASILGLANVNDFNFSASHSPSDPAPPRVCTAVTLPSQAVAVTRGASGNAPGSPHHSDAEVVA